MSRPESPKGWSWGAQRGATPAREFFDDVQRIVLHGTRWRAARYLLLDFGDKSPLHFLNKLLASGWPTANGVPKPEVQVSLGFTRLGLKQAQVPDPVLGCLALESPAFWAGAALRAASFVGLTDRNAPERWKPEFEFTKLHAVLSIHAHEEQALDRPVKELRDLARASELLCTLELNAAALSAPLDDSNSTQKDSAGQFVQFGYRDGLSRIAIEGYTSPRTLEKCRPSSIHKPGEFLLGHIADSGADPWVAGPGMRIWPDEVRAFFHNGSFGVLQQIEQQVVAFEQFVAQAAAKTKLNPREIKGKLCGRYPEGQPLVAPTADPAADFDFTRDPSGIQCPFGSHIRRMNPRVPKTDASSKPLTEEDLAQYPAQFSQSRPLLRRGMPYGCAWTSESKDDGSRGLIGHFFCASIEDQYEHLMGQWADRVPMGSPDKGGARDPIIGAHESNDGPFDLPTDPSNSLQLNFVEPFTRTVGSAYLFYPSLTTLIGIAKGCLWGLDDTHDDR